LDYLEVRGTSDGMADLGNAVKFRVALSGRPLSSRQLGRRQSSRCTEKLDSPIISNSLYSVVSTLITDFFEIALTFFHLKFRV
jgi:hypothetical protein